MLPSDLEQRWQLPAPIRIDSDLRSTGLAEPLLAVLQRRGYNSQRAVDTLLNPPQAPDPKAHFPDLALAVARLHRACQRQERLAICGDYDADGMTSTALLVGVLDALGAKPQAAIPSRLDDGYGLNSGMVERLAAQGVRLLVTVDNGVAAAEALKRAKQLQMDVVVTDHHTLPQELPPLLALLHPACTPGDSPYRGLAGVGLAYVLAAALAEQAGSRQATAMALDLFCIGTIADMAPLQGVNRRWLIDGLPQLQHSQLVGLQALQQVAGMERGPVDAGDVGFQIAPRINAVGRLGDPQLVVDLLTTADSDEALELARQCEQLNRQRRDLCDAIEAEARALVEADGEQRSPFLLLAQSHWHHGVIGIVAARLVDHYRLPVALLASEGDGRLRASVRAPRGFAVDQALKACSDLLERHGGHPAAGGFTVLAEHVNAVHERLCERASHWLEELGGQRLVEPEALLPLEQITPGFWKQLQKLEPFGSGHPAPLFWSHRCQIAQQKLLRGGHLQLTLRQNNATARAIAWRWGDAPLSATEVDVAFQLKANRWNGQERLQLELAALRSSGGNRLLLQRSNRQYWVQRDGNAVVIRNASGDELRGEPTDAGAISCSHPSSTHPYVQALLQDATMAMGLSP